MQGELPDGGFVEGLRKAGREWWVLWRRTGGLLRLHWGRALVAGELCMYLCALHK